MKLPSGLFQIGFADAVGTAISGIFWFYIASVLLPEKYGEISYFLGIAGMASYFSMFGTQNSIIVYTAKDIKIQATFYLIGFLAGLIGAVFVGFYFNRIDISFLIFGYIINILAIGELLGKKDFKKYIQLVTSQKVLTFVFGLSFLFLFGENYIIYGLTLSYLPFVKIVYNGFRNSKFDLSLLKSRLGFIRNNYFMNIVAAFNGQMDKLIIAPVFGFAILGNYSLSLQIISILVMFPGIIYKYTLSHDASGNRNKKLKVSTILIVIVIAIISIFLSPIIIPEIFPKYEQAISTIQIMSVAIVPATLSYIFTSKLLGTENSKFVIISNVIGVITFSTGIIFLGNILDVIGLAIAYVLYHTSIAAMLFFVRNKGIENIN